MATTAVVRKVAMAVHPPDENHLHSTTMARCLYQSKENCGSIATRSAANHIYLQCPAMPTIPHSRPHFTICLPPTVANPSRDAQRGTGLVSLKAAVQTPQAASPIHKLRRSSN